MLYSCLGLCVADDLTQVIAGHCEGVAVPITELGSTDLCISHTLIVHVLNLERAEKNTGHQLNTQNALQQMLI